MREWTREERYRVLKSADEITDLHERIIKSSYRQAYHVQPVTGLSSDPNGFACFNGVWHLFYQWCPWGAVHGLKYWYHVTSPDLMHWKNEGVGIYPDCEYDNRGVHSGSAISADGRLYFFYTGNHRDEDWTRIPYTCAAVLGDDGKPCKLDKPLFGPRDDYSEHQRDPKVFYVEEKSRYYIFIGAQSLDKKGRVLVYSSEKLLEGWEYAGELKVPGYEDLGGMWECPCIGRVGDKDILLFSPQYTKLPGRGESTNHNIYIIGNMDYDTLTFSPSSDYRHLDYGFDFYAAQLASNTGDPDSEIIISWIGLPDNHYPTEEEDWEGSMTLPRRLTIQGDRLIQKPVDAVYELRGDKLSADGTLAPVCEVVAGFDGNDASLKLFTKADGSGGLRIDYDAGKMTCTIDRTGMDKRFNTQVGEVLDMPLGSPLKKLDIFIDRSSVEIFANDGEAVFTTHLYPTEREFNYAFSGAVDVEIWSLSSSVKDDFVV
ncbi:MAG: sucrose-6-phosphate hydrolase [Eubacterium sp.]|nr:sucrose-6-phosphate hydrolase [Eubacterium sp.]